MRISYSTCMNLITLMGLVVHATMLVCYLQTGFDRSLVVLSDHLPGTIYGIILLEALNIHNAIVYTI